MTTGSALYVCIREEHVSAALLKALRADRFDFYHFHVETREFIYHRWSGGGPNRVPEYATSIEGAGALILSPDESRVLSVWEYGAWRYPGGAINSGENAVEAVHREVKEEVGLDLDPAFPLHLVLGWNQAMARDKRINDHYCMFVARALSEDFVLDMVELTRARWVPVAPLLATLASYDAAKAASRFVDKIMRFPCDEGGCDRLHVHCRAKLADGGAAGTQAAAGGVDVADGECEAVPSLHQRRRFVPYPP